MLKVPLLASLAVVVIVVTRSARAGEPEMPRWSIEGTVGGGYSAIKYGGVGSSPVWALGVVPAYAISLQFALGLGVDVTFLPNIARAWDLEDGRSLSVSAVAILRSIGRFETAVALGVQTAGFSRSEPAGGAGSASAEPLAVGPRIAVRTGYVWPTGFGLALEPSAAILSYDEEPVVPIVLVAEAIFATW